MMPMEPISVSRMQASAKAQSRSGAQVPVSADRLIGGNASGKPVSAWNRTAASSQKGPSEQQTASDQRQSGTPVLTARGDTGDRGDRNQIRGEQQRKAEQDNQDLQKLYGSYDCQTCKNRKYQDGSDDPGVSFKTPQAIAPEAAASAVRGHEMEHVFRERAKAMREGSEVVSQSVVLHTGVCPECGGVYISGGTTRTVTRKSSEVAEILHNQQLKKNGSAQGTAQAG